jgi:predicted dehydrogenase
VTSVLVVGCGSIGRRHAANAARLASVTIFDAARERAAEAARSLGVAACESLEQALAAKPDAVVVATPHHSHLPVARAALVAGADVLIEKPLAAGLDGIPDFLAQAERLGRRVRVVCNMRFHPAVAALRQALPRVGRPLFARAQYGNYLPDMRPGADYRTLYCARAEAGGGVILDAIHEIDYLLWLFGSVERVSAEADRIGDLDIDVEDYANLALVHRNGVRSEIHLDYLQRSKRRGCEIVGSEGTLIWTSEGKAPEHCLVRFRPPGNRDWETILEEPDVDVGTPFVELMTRFLAGNGRDRDLLDGHGGAEDLAIALAAHKAAATHTSVWLHPSPEGGEPAPDLIRGRLPERSEGGRVGDACDDTLLKTPPRLAALGDPPSSGEG